MSEPEHAWAAPNVELTHDVGFAEDEYVLDAAMQRIYDGERERAAGVAGLIGIWELRLFKNVYIYDLAGRLVAWGDVGPEALATLRGVYYLLSEHRGGTRAPPAAQVGGAEDLDPAYVKQAAIARVVNGVVQTSRDLINRNYQ